MGFLELPSEIEEIHCKMETHLKFSGKFPWSAVDFDLRLNYVTNLE